MSKLKLGPVADEKPVKINAELPASTYRDLLAYTEALGRETGQTIEPTQLIAPMIARFMMTDRAFAKVRRLGSRPTVSDRASPESAPAPNSGNA